MPLAGLHMDTILPAAALPLRLAGWGHAFRTEAGAAGAASRGLYRLHQFSKARRYQLGTTLCTFGRRCTTRRCSTNSSARKPVTTKISRPLCTSLAQQQDRVRPAV